MNGKTETFIHTPMVEWSEAMKERIKSCKVEEVAERMKLETFMDWLIEGLAEATMECTPAEMIVVNEPIVTDADFLKHIANEHYYFEMEDLDNLFPGQELDWNIIKKLFHEAMVEKTKEYEEECLESLAYDERKENESFKQYKKEWDFTKQSENSNTFKVYYDSEMTRLRNEIKNEQKRIKYLESLL